MSKIKRRDFNTIAAEQAGSSETVTFKSMYQKATTDGQSFLLVDNESPNPYDQLRKNVILV